MRTCLVLSAALILGFAFVPLSIKAQAASHSVVFALTSADEADWKLTVGNVSNLLAAAGMASARVELVAYGPGLAFVGKGSSVEPEIVALMAKHVRFVACENSMRMQHVTGADLIQGVETVPSGVAEVVTKQEQGWSYIKAGR